MEAYLVDHARHKVWCSPRQDDQLIIAPRRITPPRGTLNVVGILGIATELPVKKRYTHVFQYGQLDPWTINLMRQVPYWKTQSWFKVSDAINHANLELTIYTADGTVFPRTDAYYMLTDDRTVVFAIPEQKRRFGKFPGDLKEEVYFRFYSNQYFRTPGPEVKKLECGFFTPQNNVEILAMEAQVVLLKQRPGHTFFWVNGQLVDSPKLGDLNFDDYIEWVYDSSVKRVVEWNLMDLQQFRSELDKMYKFILHYDGPGDNTIDFQDDVDVYVTYKPAGGFMRGTYYNRNHEHNHRMLTHRDYSIATEPVWSLATTLTDRTDPSTNNEGLKVRLHIREGGVRRKLVQDHNRIFELYKLSDDQILNAMNGINSIVPVWTAINLENSAYTELMRVPYKQVTMDLVEKAYGYNAISVILGDTPQKMKLTSGSPEAVLPYGLAQNSLVYEFDANGKLLGWRNHINDDTYDSTSPACRLIEAVSGYGSDTLDCIYGHTDIPVPAHQYSYRVYMCYLVNGIPSNNWIDITGADSYYTIQDNKVIWMLGGQEHWLMVRTDKNVLALDLQVAQNDGLMNFTLMENFTGNPVDDLQPLTVPLAQLDIWVNNYKLIRNLDYFVQFPQVFVTNKTFMKQPIDGTLQDVHVRMMGLPQADLAFDEVEESGWVLNNQLSDNKKYDLREDRVMQINVGGCLFHRDDVLFAEQRPGGALLAPMNGLPYQVKDLIVPFRTNTNTNTYELRKRSQEVDKVVSAYMTSAFGEMGSDDLSAITARYPVVSPFFSHLVYLLRMGMLQIPEERYLSDQEVFDICKVHEPLLAYDPLTEANAPDENFAYIVPHGNETAFSLSFQAYRFMTQVVRLYGQGKISITDYLSIQI